MAPDAPWWSSGRGPEEGLDPDVDGLAAHRAARRGEDPASSGDRARDPDGEDRRDPGDAGWLGGADDPRHDGPPPPHWLTDAVDLLGRMATAGAQRFRGEGGTDREDAPHPPGQVCDACPVCIGLRAVREVRPETVAHLAEAARHLSLALKSFADAQAEAFAPGHGFEHIDLDGE